MACITCVGSMAALAASHKRLRDGITASRSLKRRACSETEEGSHVACGLWGNGYQVRIGPTFLALSGRAGGYGSIPFTERGRMERSAERFAADVSCACAPRRSPGLGGAAVSLACDGPRHMRARARVGTPHVLLPYSSRSPTPSASFLPNPGPVRSASGRGACGCENCQVPAIAWAVGGGHGWNWVARRGSRLCRTAVKRKAVFWLPY